ncbi:hypothetical protein Tco_0342767 [Tanacetum coccineum]
MEEADSDLESMFDDEVMSISGNEDEEADSDRELSVADEIGDDKVIDTLVRITNTEGTHTTIFVAFDPKVPSMYASSSSPITFQEDVQAMIAKAIWEKKNDSPSPRTWCPTKVQGNLSYKIPWVRPPWSSSSKNRFLCCPCTQSRAVSSRQVC